MDRLPERVRRALWRNNITTAQQVVALYPQRLLKLPGFGIYCLRQVEQVFFPGQRYEPPRGFGYRRADAVATASLPARMDSTVVRLGKTVARQLSYPAP
ncbi:MAG: hypothetical protein EBU07_00550 [Betaproteobacteria bacterium]|jgi:hypothetical protein|nr:hypothetical protein [Betaproteobacteria bacterium]NBS48271.1 hypothetical protein [Betaproteobacteria bacterium]